MPQKYRFLKMIFTHVQNDDYMSVKSIFDEYEPVDLSFAVNQDESLVFNDGTEEGQSMLGWTIL